MQTLAIAYGGNATKPGKLSSWPHKFPVASSAWYRAVLQAAIQPVCPCCFTYLPFKCLHFPCLMQLDIPPLLG
jgi:hypothetical protein